jgi:hypothetical protein
MSENDLNTLQEAVSILADFFSDGLEPENETLEGILQNLKFSNPERARHTLELACKILEKAHNDLNCLKKESIIAELESIGIKRFPAILSYEKSKSKPLTVDPPQLDFKNLQPGEEASATLKVTGGVIKNISSSNRLNLNSIKTDDNSSLIKVTVLGSAKEESFTEYIFIRSNKGELRVPINVKTIKEKKCPICCEGTILRTESKSKFGIVNQDNFICNVCGVSFGEQNGNFKLVGLNGKCSRYWEYYKGQSLTLQQWQNLIAKEPVHYDATSIAFVNALSPTSPQDIQNLPPVLRLMRANKEIEDLINAFNSTEFCDRFDALNQLKKIGKLSVQPLILALKSPNNNIREFSARTLGLIGDKRAVSFLKQCLSDETNSVRERAARSLDQLRSY